jgi:hypothetical protein
LHSNCPRCIARGRQRGMATKTEPRQAGAAVCGLSEQGGCDHHSFLRREPQDGKWGSQGGVFGVQKHHGHSLTGQEGTDPAYHRHRQPLCRASKPAAMSDRSNLSIGSVVDRSGVCRSDRHVRPFGVAYWLCGLADPIGTVADRPPIRSTSDRHLIHPATLAWWIRFRSDRQPAVTLSTLLRRLHICIC